MRARPALLLLGVLLIASGLVWMAQGLNIDWAPQSFMTADRLWVFVGAATILAGTVLVGWSRPRA